MYTIYYIYYILVFTTMFHDIITIKYIFVSMFKKKNCELLKLKHN